MRRGRDKVENEELLRYGLPTDVWFHVEYVALHSSPSATDPGASCLLRTSTSARRIRSLMASGTSSRRLY